MLKYKNARSELSVKKKDIRLQAGKRKSATQGTFYLKIISLMFTEVVLFGH